MEESKKLPLKRVELSLTKFNEVAIPHHLDLLRQHRANIKKYEQSGDLTKVRVEQTNAARVTAQLRTLLRDLELLRSQVQENHLSEFDMLTQTTRDQTHKAIMEYLESAPVIMSRSHHTQQTPMVSSSAMSTDSVGLVAHQEAESEEISPVMLQLEEELPSLAEREAVLKGWNELQHEVKELKEVWEHVQGTVVRQREQVEAIAGSVEVTDINVAEARTALANAERLKTAWYPLAGLVVGGAVGGPIGLCIGFKAAAAAAFAGSCLGYTGVTTLLNRRRNNPQEPGDGSKKDK